MLAEAKGANCDGVLSVQLVPGTPADRVGIAQFTLLDVKQLVSAAAIDSAALATGSSDGSCPRAARQSSRPDRAFAADGGALTVAIRPTFRNVGASREPFALRCN